MVQWYATVVGAHVAMCDDMTAFLTYDDEHHGVALIAAPHTQGKPQAADHPGVEHVAFVAVPVGDGRRARPRLTGAAR
jgi:catechol-2,3-dioxygenase